MTNTFIKKRECGCVVMATMCGIETTEDDERVMLDGHKYLMVCEACNTGQDAMCDDTWRYTHKDGTNGWVPYKNVRKYI